MAEVISLLTSSDDDEASASAVPAPAPSLTHRAARPKKRAASRAKRGGNWRRRAGDSSTASPAGPADAAEAVLVAQLETSLSAAELRAELLGFGLRPGCRTKAGLAERLVRARRAAAASEALYAHSQPRGERYDTARSGTVAGAQLCGCRLCGGDILPPRRTFCCDECVPPTYLPWLLLTMAPLTFYRAPRLQPHAWQVRALPPAAHLGCPHPQGHRTARRQAVRPTTLALTTDPSPNPNHPNSNQPQPYHQVCALLHRRRSPPR